MSGPVLGAQVGRIPLARRRSADARPPVPRQPFWYKHICGQVYRSCMVARSGDGPRQAMEEELARQAATIADLQAKLGIYENQQSEWKNSMTSVITAEVERLTEGLRQVHGGTVAAVDEMRNRIVGLEKFYSADKGGSKGKAAMLQVKDMKPDVLTKEEDWRRWQADILDYAEEVHEGMKEILEKVKKSDVEIDEIWFEEDTGRWWGKAEQLYRFLKHYTGTEARRVVMGVREDNGYEAWRKLNQQYEPGTADREARVMARFTSMVNRKAKNPKETKTMMIELIERAKRVEEVTGQAPDDRHVMSVIAGILDPETAKHTAQFQGMKKSVEVLKRKVMEFTNLVVANGDDKMDIGLVRQADEDYDYYEEEKEEEPGCIAGFNQQCHKCQGYGHFARECPTKGDGKGKGGGKGIGKGAGKGEGRSEKGKGKGKTNGPKFGSCFICGGPHYKNQCPNNEEHKKGQSKGFEKGGSNQVRMLSAIRHVTPGVETRNRFQVLQEDDREDKE